MKVGSSLFGDCLWAVCYFASKMCLSNLLPCLGLSISSSGEWRSWSPSRAMAHHTVPLGSGGGAPIRRVSPLSVWFPFYQSHPRYILYIKPSWQGREEDPCVFPWGCPTHTWNRPHCDENLSYCILQPLGLWYTFFAASFSKAHVLAFKPKVHGNMYTTVRETASGN